MAERLMLSVSGCRGIVGKTMTPAVASRFAGLFAGLVIEKHREDKPTVVVGRDGRAGGEPLLEAAIDGLCKAGCRVVNLGVATTPTVGIMVDKYEAHAGLVLTASHNPQEWNGLKALWRTPGTSDETDCGALPPDLAADLIARFEGGMDVKQADEEGDVEDDTTGVATHWGKVKEAMDGLKVWQRIRKAKFSVVVDSINSSGAPLAKAFLEALGCDVLHLNDKVTGKFAHTPEPTRENLKELCDVVQRNRADVGFAQDPDADRLALVDKSGKYIGEEYTLALAAMAVLRLGATPRVTLCTNLSTSRMIEDLAGKLGAKVARSPVGEANVVALMKKKGSPLGGEGNGGVIWPQVVYIRDSIAAMGLILALMAEEKGKRALSEMVAMLPTYAIEKRKREFRQKETLAKAVEVVAAALKGEGTPDTQDGFRLDVPKDSAWLHVRTSNTEPIVRLIAEAPTSEKAKAWLDRAEQALEALPPEAAPEAAPEPEASAAKPVVGGAVAAPEGEVVARQRATAKKPLDRSGIGFNMGDGKPKPGTGSAGKKGAKSAAAAAAASTDDSSESASETTDASAESTDAPAEASADAGSGASTGGDDLDALMKELGGDSGGDAATADAPAADAGGTDDLDALMKELGGGDAPAAEAPAADAGGTDDLDALLKELGGGAGGDATASGDAGGGDSGGGGDDDLDKLLKELGG